MTIPSRLDLASNRLTVATLDFLCQHAGPTLTKLCMSNNNLGPMALQRLPDLFSACTSLKTLELSSCDLGDYMLLDNTTIEKYNQMRLDDDAVPVELDISQNHFDGDMLSGWTPYLVKLGRIQKLQCRGITTDSPWDTLGLLSDLPFLTSLDLDDTAASSWSASDLRDILQKSIHLERLSLCNCYLTPQDVTTICQGVAVSSYLRWLSLSNNRRVNLTIAQAVNDMNSDLTANTCDCGLTSQHHPAFCQCRNIGDTGNL
ncbi:uncharacterized protein BYT42DRAFT_363014 [Radiomyces spectabilis]|uniref:uncharacterized protein n=1 Tax=Radiomyces spectabilis TaxID=64574 RepID=UPI002220D862|nr:uncharacterized protein BYT42DRAFT_363014 [Radiomyces spectabilis]KAI8377957.1 hypothetical protein BYT42DRAFT_363014 [Radiomyces spectabilis]